jgi:hypothetical protein
MTLLNRVTFAFAGLLLLGGLGCGVPDQSEAKKKFKADGTTGTNPNGVQNIEIQMAGGSCSVVVHGEYETGYPGWAVIHTHYPFSSIDVVNWSTSVPGTTFAIVFPPAQSPFSHSVGPVSLNNPQTSSISLGEQVSCVIGCTDPYTYDIQTNGASCLAPAPQHKDVLSPIGVIVKP